MAFSMSERTGPAPYFKDAVIRDRRLASRMLGLHHLLERSGSRLARETLFFEVMGELVAKYATPAPQPRPLRCERKAVNQAVAYIQDNLTENISLKELSRHVGLSPFYLSRIFQQQVGLPPHAYQKQQRIYLAKQLLRCNTPIATAAAQAGFADQSHLTRHFKQILGVTPGLIASPQRFSKKHGAQ